MIACDDENREFQWLHLDCVGLTKAPRGKWFCNDCRPLKRKHTKKAENRLNLSDKNVGKGAHACLKDFSFSCNFFLKLPGDFSKSGLRLTL